MKPKTVKAEDIIEMIRRDIAASSQSSLAKKIGISAPYLYDMLNGARPVSESVALYYGFEKETVFVKAS